MTEALLYPFAPLAEAMGLGPNAAGVALGLAGRTQQQYRRIGMTEKVADRMATRAGFHPFTIWPEMVDRAIASIEQPCAKCGTPFVPARDDPRYRYCSTVCSKAGDRARLDAKAARERARYHGDPVKRARRNATRRAYYERYGA